MTFAPFSHIVGFSICRVSSPISSPQLGAFFLRRWRAKCRVRCYFAAGMLAAQQQVAVTGASGYIGGSLTQKLLGTSVVKAVVRDPTSPSLGHLRYMMRLFPSSLTLVHVPELTKPSIALDSAFESCSIVYHVANPIGPSTEGLSDEEFESISVRSVEVVLRAAHKAGVQRVVLTASMASVCGSQALENPQHVYTENDWNDECGSRYSRAKTRAEEAAWACVRELPGLELAVINPSLVLGPTLIGQKPRSSNASLCSFASGELTREETGNTLQPGFFGIVHIDDVVEAHVLAGERSQAAGQRYLTTLPDQYSTLEICLKLKELFPFLEVPTKYGRGVPNSTPAVAPRKPSSDNSKVTELLGRPLRSLDRALVDGICAMITHGFLTLKR